ncbi:MAG: porin [Gammaproteobacteria bacterium]|nr:porin [Gammaproteobacteria bacterium]
MKMKFIAAAVLAGLAAPVVHAAPEVYGAIHLSVDGLNNGNSTDSKVTTLSSNSSYIGIRGSDDLGDGMKGIYGGEFQIGFDTSAASGNPWINRNVFAGLSGGFGTFRAGNYDDVVKQIGRKVDMFWSEQLGESRSLTRGGNGKNIGDERLANSLNYESPSFSGVTLTLNIGLENTTTENTPTVTNKSKQTAVGAQFSQGPIYAGYAHKKVILAPITLSATQGDSSTIDRVSAQYTMGNIVVGALYQKVKDEGGLAGANRNTMGIGGGFTIGQGMIKAQYYKANDNGKTTTSAGAGGAKLTAIGYDYNMSKSTAVYVVYANVKNDNATTAANGGVYSVIGAGHANPQDATYGATTGGMDPKGWSVGMKVKF